MFVLRHDTSVPLFNQSIDFKKAHHTKTIAPRKHRDCILTFLWDYQFLTVSFLLKKVLLMKKFIIPKCKQPSIFSGGVVLLTDISARMDTLFIIQFNSILPFLTDMKWNLAFAPFDNDFF